MFQTFELSDYGYERRGSDEPEGTKNKFWIRATDRLAGDLGISPGHRVLFKYHRKHEGRYRGEDWAEKVASELAKLLDLPAARVELATFRGHRGILSPSFLERPGRRSTDLVLGNRLLYEDDPDYPEPHAVSATTRREPKYTVEAAAGCLAYRGVLPPEHGTPVSLDGATFFAGYLLFDAWIANTDRHHANWGVTDAGTRLAPTFDHAASLGQALDDTARSRRLSSTSRQDSMDGYVRSPKARSCFFEDAEDLRQVSMVRAWQVVRE